MLAEQEVQSDEFQAAARRSPQGASEMAERRTGWSREFDEPIALPNGRKLVTLQDAAEYITLLPREGEMSHDSKS
jgi:hypothetical protein